MTQNGTPPSAATALLKNAVGQKIRSLQTIVRYPLEKLASDLSLSDSSAYFRFAPEVVFIELHSGHKIRINSDARRRTVLVSEGSTDPLVEADKPDYLERRGVVLSASDPNYADDQMQALVGATIRNIGIVSVDDGDTRAINERGIAIYFDDDTHVIIGLQLRGSVVSSLSFLKFDDVGERFRPFLRLRGVDGAELPIPNC